LRWQWTLSAWWSARFVFASFVVTYMLANMLLVVVCSTLMMALRRKRVAATQFSSYMAVSNLAFGTGSGLLGAARVGAVCGAVVRRGGLIWIDVSAHEPSQSATTPRGRGRTRFDGDESP
jgi:hypothetical protein